MKNVHFPFLHVFSRLTVSGTFHLIHMLMDDYIVHQLESRLEADQQREYEHKIALLKDGRREGGKIGRASCRERV